MALDKTHPPRLNLGELNTETLSPLTKGLPFDAPPLTVAEIAAQHWHLLSGDLPFPAAIIKRDTLAANSAWMSEFTRTNGLEISPHGKTTMAPHLYDLQIADGAWAITVATVQQMNVCRKYGVRRVILANQPVGRQAIEACFRALQAPDPIELYCLADSLDGITALAAGAERNPPSPDNPLRVLVEIGFPGGRTGARSRNLALDIANAVATTPGLALAGIECFEGVLPDVDAAGALVDEVIATGRAVVAADLLPDGAPLILSAGGTAFFDRVGERLRPVELDRPVLRVLRSGCYLTHDSIGYAKAFDRIRRETSLALPDGSLQPAMEIWAQVQSRPDPDKAILTMGKRDAGFDAGLPLPLLWYRPDGSMKKPETVPDGHVVQDMNDQHCHLIIPDDSPLQVGDLMGFGIGHPCTTFDKWNLIMIVDADYQVTGAIRTFF